MSTNAVLQIQDLTKRYPAASNGEGKLALDRLNLTVYRGEIFGYLGPNGAGKTTTIRLLLDLIRPTSGSANILGLDAQKQSVNVKRFLGNLPSELTLWEHMTGTQIIHYLAGLRPGCDTRYAMQLAERLDLHLNQRVGSYSTGNRRKLGIVQALMHKPPFLILDEPTNGLDPLVRQTFNQMLEEVRDEGRTVFLSSHVLSEVEQICDRVGVLRDGVLQAVEGVHDLKQAYYRWVTIRTTETSVFNQAEWSALDGVEDVRITPGQVRLRVCGRMDAVVKLAARYPVDDLKVEEPSLEHFFMTFYDSSGSEGVKDGARRHD